LVTTLSSQSSTLRLSRVCTKSPPATERTVSPSPFGSASPSVSSRRRFFLLVKICMASAVADGATITSVNTLTISAATSASIGRLSATMPPKALTGSVLSAFL